MKVLDPLFVFRFQVVVAGIVFGAFDARWEGLVLVITKALDKAVVEAGMPRAERLIHVFENHAPVALEVLDRDHERLVRWELHYDEAVDRGFDLLHAQKDDLVREAVALTNARVVACGTGRPS